MLEKVREAHSAEVEQDPQVVLHWVNKADVDAEAKAMQDIQEPRQI